MITVVVLALLALLLPPSVIHMVRAWFGWHPKNQRSKPARLFEIRRNELQSQFLKHARKLGKPRGLIWTKADWKEETAFARDLETGLLTAFSSLEIHFAAEPGGEMEDVEAVEYFRQASAIFHYSEGCWGTGGRALFNMTPTEAVSRLQGQFAPVSENEPDV